MHLGHLRRLFAFLPTTPAGCRWKANDEMSDGTNTNDQTDNSGKDEGKGADDVTGLKSALQAERDARKAADKTAKDLARELEMNP